MTNPRATKRRRLSDIQSADEDGDIQMQEGNSPVASKTSEQQQPSKAHLDNAQDTTMVEKEDSQVDGTGTPLRTGLRSSGRQRKPPQRYEDEVLKTPSSIKKPTTGAGANARTPRSSRKAKTISNAEEVKETPPPPPRGTVTRTRSKRVSVKSASTKPQDEDRSVIQDKSRQSSSAEEYQDGLDDLVTMQLQQDLTQHDAIEKDDSAVPLDSVPDYAEGLQRLVQTGCWDELQLLTKTVLEKVNGKRLVPLKGLENEYLKVRQLIEQTVTVGEGNSMLLLGSRGCGKTAIVETIISSIRREHNNDFHVIRLNGFLHTDDRLALREMWRQLGRETNTEQEAGKVSSYADTMTTLLALLSHPEELFGPSDNPETVTAAKSIIIILDEFDQFVTHPRQTLLYNLFDIAQARKAPIAVLGLTTKVDVTEMLEKRVKSRFSHRYVYVPLPRSFETFSEICFAGLNLEDSENSELLDADVATQAIVKSIEWNNLLRGWRSYLQGLWDDEPFKHHLQKIYHQTKSVKEFFTSALLPVTELYYSTHDSSLQIPTPKAFASQPLSCPDPAPLPFFASTTASASPSSLPLSLLLAATRLTALYDPGVEGGQSQNLAPLALSFPAAYAEYVRLLTSAKTSASVSGAAVTPGRVWGRDVAQEAWEKLVSWGLINPVGGGSGTADGRMFRVEVSFEEVVAMAGSGGSLGKWWRE